MIKVENLSFNYGKKKVFDHFQLNLSGGSIYGILGPNGVGKTTLFQLLSGLTFPNDGRVIVNGHVPKKREEGFYQKMVYLPEDLTTPTVSPYQYVKLLGPMYPNYDEQIFLTYSERFGIDYNQVFNTMSAGVLRKAWLAVVLSYQTPLLMLDEPSKAMDIEGQRLLRKMLLEIQAEGRTIVLSTHHLREMEQLFDHVTIMDETGHVVLSQPVDTLTQDFRTEWIDVKPTSTAVISYERSSRGYLALFKEPSDSGSDIPLELIYNGLTKRKEV